MLIYLDPYQCNDTFSTAKVKHKGAAMFLRNSVAHVINQNQALKKPEVHYCIQKS